MTKLIIKSVFSVKRYYEKVISNKLSNPEGLFEPPDYRFIEILGHNDSALNVGVFYDLGYGYGSYSMEAAKRGFKVISVDILNPTIFLERLRKHQLCSQIDVIESSLQDYEFKYTFDFLVAVNVLHFIPEDRIIRILRNVKHFANPKAAVFIVIFTDIRRQDGDTKVLLEDEAGLSLKRFQEICEKSFNGWKYSFEIRAYQEVSERTQQIYFTANQICFRAFKPE